MPLWPVPGTPAAGLAGLFLSKALSQNVRRTAAALCFLLVAPILPQKMDETWRNHCFKPDLRWIKANHTCITSIIIEHQSLQKKYRLNKNNYIEMTPAFCSEVGWTCQLARPIALILSLSCRWLCFTISRNSSSFPWDPCMVYLPTNHHKNQPFM